MGKDNCEAIVEHERMMTAIQLATDATSAVTGMDLVSHVAGQIQTLERERDEARCALSAACARLADVLNLTLPSHYDPVDAIAADIGRLLDVERLWIEACRIARACCHVRDGESHVRDGIPRLSDSLADARRERDEAREALSMEALVANGQAERARKVEIERDALRAECDDLHRTIDVLRAEMSELRNAASHSCETEGEAMTVQCQHFVCHQCECESCNTLRRELDDVRIDAAVETLYATKATDRAEKAEAELADIKESFRRTVDGKCAPDEWHCSCVPALRAEVERLRVALGKIASIDPHVNGVGLYCREFATAVLATKPTKEKP